MFDPPLIPLGVVNTLLARKSCSCLSYPIIYSSCGVSCAVCYSLILSLSVNLLFSTIMLTSQQYRVALVFLFFCCWIGHGYPTALRFPSSSNWLKRNLLEEATVNSARGQWEATATFLRQLLQNVRGKLKNTKELSADSLKNLRSLEQNLIQLIKIITLMTKTDESTGFHDLGDEQKSAMIGRMVNQPTYVINQLIRMEQMRNRRQKQLQESLQEW